VPYTDIVKKIKTSWGKRQEQKLLKEYYRRQSTCVSSASCLFQNTVLFTFLSLVIVWKSSTMRVALWGVLIIAIVIIIFRYFEQKKENKQLKKNCYKKIAEKEFWKRVEKVQDDKILMLLGKEIEKKKLATHIKTNEGMLEGILNYKKLAVIYLEVTGEDMVATKDLMSVIRRCIQEGIQQVRVFTNGEFGDNAMNLKQRYDIDLRLYNSDKLIYLLKNTFLFPSLSEVEDIINHKKAKRQKRLNLIKREILERKHFGSYIMYSVILLLMSWYRIGVVYLNILAGISLLSLAFALIIKELKIQESETYFEKEGL